MGRSFFVGRASGGSPRVPSAGPKGRAPFGNPDLFLLLPGVRPRFATPALPARAKTEWGGLVVLGERGLFRVCFPSFIFRPPAGCRVSTSGRGPEYGGPPRVQGDYPPGGCRAAPCPPEAMRVSASHYNSRFQSAQTCLRQFWKASAKFSRGSSPFSPVLRFLHSTTPFLSPFPPSVSWMG